MAVWASLGTITPVLTDWQLFPYESVAGRSFRIVFGNVENATFKSYGIVRPVYTWPELSVGEGKRVYPAQEPKLLEFAIPEDLVAAGATVRSFSIRKYIYYRWRGRWNEPIWTATLEELSV